MAEKVVCAIAEDGYVAEVVESDIEPGQPVEARYSITLKCASVGEDHPRESISGLTLDDLTTLHRLTKRAFDEVQFQLGRSCPPEL
jgi:hypothetical protein